MDFPIENLYGNSMIHCILMYCLYEKFESIKAVLNTGRETHNLEIQYKYNKCIFIVFNSPKKIHRSPLVGLESGSFLLRHYKITQRWAKVFPKALVERNSVMVEVFYMILISQKYDQKPTILKG